jgi:RNA polymerase sigma-70 factor (ECF subfamily)
MDAVFTNYIKQKQKHIYNMCFRYVGNEIDSELLKSTVLEKMWTKRHQFKPETGISGFCRWANRIVHNEFVNFKRSKHQRNSGQDIDQVTCLQSEHDVHRGLEVSDKLRIIFDFVSANWDEDHVKVFHMVFVSGMRYQDVADDLSIPVNTVKTRIFRIRESVQQLR